MLTVTVCEDEPLLRHALTQKLRIRLAAHRLPVQVLDFASGEELLSSPHLTDVAFVDIKLGGMDGMATVRRLRERGTPCQVVFLTAYPEYVFDAFDLDAVHYLVKPVGDKALFHALDRALYRLTPDCGPVLTVTTGEKVRILPLADLLCCEVMDHSITLHTFGEDITCSGALHVLETSLDNRFLRCHKSYLINLDHVRAVEGDTVRLSNGMAVPVSRRRRRVLADQLLIRVRNEVMG